MNKRTFLQQLEKEANISERDTIVVSDILDDYFVFGKKNKDIIIEAIKEKLTTTDEKADEIYNVAMSIITTNIKEKIKHPFKTQD